MSDETPEAAAGSEPVTDAIAALTAAARQTRTIGLGTANAHKEPADFGEIACLVITSVAANVGGVDTLLSGRPGSWEADYIRRIVQSTAGEDEADLLRYRTEPVRLALDVEGTFDDFGLYELYTEAAEEFERRQDAAETALFDAVATDEEKARLQQIRTLSSGRLFVEEDPAKRERESALVHEAQGIIETITQRAREVGATAVADLDQAVAQQQALEQLWEQDQAAYAAAYRETVQRTLAERGTTVGLELLIDAPGASWAGDAPQWDLLAEDLHQIAREKTPLPMTGQAPDWTEGTPAEALRRSGYSFVTRVEQQGRPE